MANILQNDVLVEFVYPFLLIFFVVFAVLEKTKIFGDDKKQINALVGLIIGLMFVATTSPRLLVDNLIWFLAVSLIIVFVVMLLWGFVTGGEANFGDFKAMKIIGGILIVLAVLIAVFVFTGIWDSVYDTLFSQDWSSDLWSNVIFLVVIAGALAAVLAGTKK